mmetsp:Transcript_35525/g.47975  ORF Transcript_35525/g.47975 Transcript_35525/m.47975 type:complete len:216 (-) Transcript_35525:217-864(-)
MRRYHVVPFEHFFEFIFGMALFCVFGAKIAASAYLYAYMIKVSNNGDSVDELVLMIWTTCTLSRIIGVIDQSLIPFSNVSTVLRRSVISMILASYLIGLVILDPLNKNVFWYCIIGYFLMSGPTLGYTYDANHRITIPTPKGTAIIKFGFQMGSSFVPFITSELWKTCGPLALRIVLLTCAIIPGVIYEVAKGYVKKMSQPDEHKPSEDRATVGI